MHDLEKLVRFKLNRRRLYRILLVNLALIFSYIIYYYNKIPKTEVIQRVAMDSAGSEMAAPALQPLALGIPGFILIIAIATFLLVLYSPLFRLIGVGEQKIIMVLDRKGPMTGYKLIQETKLPRSSTYEFIKKLEKENIITKDGQKLYLTSEVKQELK